MPSPLPLPCYANDPKKEGYTTLAPALDLTTSLRGDLARQWPKRPEVRFCHKSETWRCQRTGHQHAEQWIAAERQRPPQSCNHPTGFADFGLSSHTPGNRDPPSPSPPTQRVDDQPPSPPQAEDSILKRRLDGNPLGPGKATVSKTDWRAKQPTIMSLREGR